MIDTLWVLICSALVFLMQGGFLCLESGLTRSKNAINVALKNVTDFSVSMLLFWLYGFALMYGASHAGWFGTTHFLVPMDRAHSTLATTFLFQAMFCATAATIVSGAVAGRMRFGAYIVVTVAVSGMVYPIFGHWAWGGTSQAPSGWLAAKGFVDFAGSSVVHGVGGWAALAAVLVLGPRAGQFAKDRPKRMASGSNLPLAMLGTMLLWIGWIGFNGGSTLAMNDQVPGIIGNTFLSGVAGMLTALAIGWFVRGYADVTLVINGSLAGMVAVTAGCHAIVPGAAVVTGSLGAVVMLIAQWLINRHEIDDVIGAVPVHAAAGAWGTIAVALFGSPELLGTGLSFWAQLQVQLLGVMVVFAATLGTTYLLLRIVGRIISLRVTPEHEHIGLNVSEHGASTELHELLTEMELQRESGDFSRRVHVEPGSDVAWIAAQYNRVLEKVNQETSRARQLAESADLARRNAEQASVDLEHGEHRLRTIVETAKDGILTIDPEGKITSFNGAAREMFGYRIEEVVGEHVTMLISSPGTQRHAGEIATSSITARTIIAGDDREVLGRRKSGSTFPLEIAVNEIRMHGARFFTAILRDLTQQRATENALRRSEAYANSILNSLVDALYVVAANGTITTANGALCKLLGYTEDELVGQPARVLFEQQSAPVAEPRVETVVYRQDMPVQGKDLRTLARNDQVRSVECRFRTKDGRAIPVSFSASVMRNTRGEIHGIICIAQGVTRQHELRGELAQARRLEAIGKLAAGIAHEINSPTQYLGDNTRFLKGAFADVDRLLERCQSLLQSSRDGSVDSKLLAEIEALFKQTDLPFLREEIPQAIDQSLEGVARVGKIVGAMKEFSQPGTEEKCPVDLSELLESTITLTRSEWSHVAEIVQEFDPKLPPVLCLPEEMKQVFLNFIVNAARAIGAAQLNGNSQRGTITVGTRHDGDRWAVVFIRDTGSGIPADVREQIFEPKLRTNESDEWMGQGLDVARHIVVAKHGGTIRCYCNEDEGTTFLIRLPLEIEENAPDAPREVCQS